MSVQITPSPPDLKSSDREVFAVAKYLRHNSIVKAREAILDGARVDMFRLKRAVRALLDPAYAKARAKNPALPEVSSREAAMQLLARFPTERFAFNVTKLETEDAIAKGLKPQSGIPVVLIAPQQRVADNEYFVWFYNPTPLSTYFYATGLVLALIAAALFQLWPTWARRGIYYLSLAAMAFLGFLIGLTIVRLVLFLATSVVLSKAIWLFPNLYADVSFFDSFRPFWAWSGVNTLPKKEKRKKRKSKAAATNHTTTQVPQGAVPGVTPGALPGQAGPDLPRQQMTPMAVGPDGKPVPIPPFVKQALDASAMRTEQQVKEILEKEGAKSPEEVEALKQRLFKENWAAAQQGLRQIAMQIQAQAQAQANAQAQ